MSISDWSSDVCSSDLKEAEYYAGVADLLVHLHARPPMDGLPVHGLEQWLDEVMLFTDWYCPAFDLEVDRDRSEEHTSELQSLMRISYAVFCLKKKKKQEL